MKKTRGTKTTTRKARAPKTKAVEATVERPVETTPTDDAGEVVVFAIRLKRSERDLIHAAAGSGKASEFVRGLAIAGARRDMKAVEEIVDAAHAAR